MTLTRKLSFFMTAATLSLLLGCAQPRAGEVQGGSPGYAGPSDEAEEAPSTPACNYPAEWVGKKVDREAIKATGRPFRVLHPDDAATMDYSPDRLNVMIDDSDVVTEVKCG